MYTKEQEAGLVSDLLYAMGLDVNPVDNIVIDQDTHQPLLFEFKNIKVTRNINKPAFISENDIRLEPANPKCTKLMNRLFSFFTDKEYKYGNIGNILTFYFDDDLEKGISSLVVKYEGGEVYRTNWYRSKALIFTEAILDIDGSYPINGLEIFDVDPDVEIPRRGE